MLPEKSTIGIVGGGQLGKMLIEASRPWNVRNIVLENDLNCPASLVADEVIEGSLKDAEKIRELANKCDVLTFEIEHINVDVLLELEKEGKTIIPSPKILKVIQDKGAQKDFFSSNQLSTVPYKHAATVEEIKSVLNEFPGEKIVVKNCRGGYDGKGVSIVSKQNVLENKFQSEGPFVVESFFENIVEYSVIVARDKHGKTVTFPLVEMYFNPLSNLVEFLFSPAKTDEKTERICRELAGRAIDCFGGPGLFAVELFVNESGRVFINEIAPRPHNSGHHTIEGCYTSQFEQLNRILLDLPLGNTDCVQPCAMINLVGPEGLSGDYRLTHTDQLLEMPGVYIHLYNKKDIKPHRKMGHVTVLAESLEELMDKAEKVQELCSFSAR